MHDGEMALLPERLKGRQRRMKAEEAVEVENVFARNADAGPHRVILRLGVRHDDVKPIGGAALKNHDQPFGACARRRRTEGGASQKSGYRCRSDDGERAVTKKDATSDHANAPGYEVGPASCELPVHRARLLVARRLPIL